MPPVVTELGGPQVGRMATTDRRSEKWNLDPGLFSVVIGVPPAPATLQPSGTRGSAGTIKENEYSMVFYRAKADALDESSHLQGRTEGTEITSARRSRAVGGVFKMTMKQLGGLGVGRVAGYLHPARSTTQPLAQQAPSPGSAAPKEDDAGRVARMEACNNLTPKYVGATTQGFPCSVPAIGLAPAHIDRLHAKIVYTATIADAAGPQGSLGDPSFNVMCGIETYNFDVAQSVHSKLDLDRLEAAQYFGLAPDPLLDEGGRDAFMKGDSVTPAIHIVGAVEGAHVICDKGVIERSVLALLAASQCATVQEISNLRNLDSAGVSLKILEWLGVWRSRLAMVPGGVDAVEERGRERLREAGVSRGHAGWNYAPYGVALEELESAGGGQMQTPQPTRAGQAAAPAQLAVPRSALTIGRASPTSPVAPLQALLGPVQAPPAAAAPMAAPRRQWPDDGGPALTAAPAAPEAPARVHFAPDALQRVTQQVVAPGGGARVADAPMAAAPVANPFMPGPPSAAEQRAGFNTLRGAARGVTPLQVKATMFSEAVVDDAAFDAFLINSAMLTTSAAMRESLLAPPFDASKRAALCGALEDYLESSNAGDVTMRAMLPVAVGGAGMSWADLMGVLRTLSDAARRGSSSGVAAPPSHQQQNITVRVDGGGGATITAGLPDEDRVEAQSIGQDVSDVASTPSLMNELRALGNMASSASPSASLAAAVDGAGEPIRRMLRTTLTEHLERLMAHNSYSGETMQTVHTVRNALARRQWSSVHGASSEPNAEEKKIMRACVAGCLGKARPALFMTSMLPDGTSVGASSATDPLGFLEKVPAAEAALGLAVLLTVAHLQVAFPAQAAQTMRFYVALLKWVRSQRAQQASWAVLSEWWAGLFRHIDQRFVALMTRRASSLPPLDPKCLTEPTTEYNMRYTHARAMELARSAAAKVEAEGQNALSKAIAAAVKEQTKNLRSGGGGKRPEVPAGSPSPNGKKGRGGKGADRGTSESGGRGGGGGGGKQGGSAQPLAITDKSEGLSGKSVASKEKHWKEGEPWDLTKVIASLESELGKWEGKSPCPFYHIKGKCSFAPKDCRRFH